MLSQFNGFWTLHTPLQPNTLFRSFLIGISEIYRNKFPSHLISSIEWAITKYCILCSQFGSPFSWTNFFEQLFTFICSRFAQYTGCDRMARAISLIRATRCCRRTCIILLLWIQKFVVAKQNYVLDVQTQRFKKQQHYYQSHLKHKFLPS